MMNKKFKRAAIRRKFGAFFFKQALTTFIVFGFLIFLFIQSDNSSFSQIIEALGVVFSSSTEEATSSNYS